MDKGTKIQMDPNLKVVDLNFQLIDNKIKISQT